MDPNPPNTGALTPGEPTDLKSLLSTVPASVVSRTLMKHPSGSVTLFSFDAGQALSEHTAPFDALVTVLAGSVEITVGGKPSVAQAGETVFMPAKIPHALRAPEAFRMVLVMLKA